MACGNGDGDRDCRGVLSVDRDRLKVVVGPLARLFVLVRPSLGKKRCCRAAPGLWSWDVACWRFKSKVSRRGRPTAISNTIRQKGHTSVNSD